MAADKAIEPGKKSTERYLPEKAWAKLSPEERERTDEKKKRESRKGKQFVKNTERAKKRDALYL
jgi:Zn-dependent oligopeptidase